MDSGFKQWESDPLFLAAEVVQDSVDRMDTIFRLLLHELSVYQDEHPDQKLLTSIDYHRRDLATTHETAKWQLEDFERAVNLSTISHKSRLREDVIFRHKQFVRAIREQILHVEKSLEDSLVGYPMNNTEWVSLNEQDRDGLALFLSGGDRMEHLDHGESENNILKRFLDPSTASTSKDATCEIIAHKNREIESMNMNGAVHTSRSFDSNLRKVGSHYSARLGLEALGSLQEASCDRRGEDVSWDLEANRAKLKSCSDENKLRGYSSRTNLFGFFNNLWTTYGSKVGRTFTKKLKDEEEQRDSSSDIDISCAVQGHCLDLGLASESRSFHGLCCGLLRKTMHQFQICRARYQRFPYYVLANNRRSVISTLAILCTLIVFGILMSYIT